MTQLIGRSEPTPAASTHDTHRETSAGLRLPQATALIVGSIIGVGIFNLPGSLAAYGPISLFAMRLTTVGALALAMMFARMATRMPARRALRLRPGRVRQHDGLLQRLAVLDHRVVGQRRDRRRLGALRRGVREQGCRHDGLHRDRPGRSVDPGDGQPDRRAQHGRRPAVDDDPQVRAARLDGDGRPALRQDRQLPPVEHQR